MYELLAAGKPVVWLSKRKSSENGRRTMDGSAIREHVVEFMLQTIAEEPYPSATMMDGVERALRTREQVSLYAQLLAEKIQSSRYLNVPMLNRLEAVLARIE